MREEAQSVNERDFIFAAARDGVRTDGRGVLVARDVRVARVPGSNGVVEVAVGDTRCVAATHAEVVAPAPERPSEGFFAFLVDFSPMASPAYELQAGVVRRQADVARVVERAVRQGRALDVEGLCILAGRKVWSVRVDVRVLDDAGNVCDCACLATLASLLSFRRNDVTVTGDDVVVVCFLHSSFLHLSFLSFPPMGRTLHLCVFFTPFFQNPFLFHHPHNPSTSPIPYPNSTQQHGMDEREPVPLVVHHVPLSTTFALLNATTCVLDPLLAEERVALGTLTVTANKFGEICGVHKAGGVPVDQRVLLRCTDIALDRARHITEVLTQSLGLTAAH